MDARPSVAPDATSVIFVVPPCASRICVRRPAKPHTSSKAALSSSRIQQAVKARAGTGSQGNIQSEIATIAWQTKPAGAVISIRRNVTTCRRFAACAPRRGGIERIRRGHDKDPQGHSLPWTLDFRCCQ